MGKRSIDLEIVGGQVMTSTPGLALGGQQAQREDARKICSQQDQPVTVGRRVLATAGIMGAPQFSVANGDDPAAGFAVYPAAGFERTRIVVGQRLTPGHRLRVEGLALPSGPNSATLGTGSWFEQGRYGSLIVEVDYVAPGDSSSVAVELAVPSSGEAFGAEPQAFAGSWMRVLSADLPVFDAQDPDFSGEVDVTITIISKGSLRLIDCCVYETPNVLTHDDTHREGMVHLAQGTYPSEYALTGANLPTDARWGARQALKCAHDQRMLWGPAIFQWSSWDESTAGVTDAEPDPLVISSTSFVGIPYSGITSYSEDNPGWSVSSGGTARGAEWAGILELREGVGVVPVVVRVYGRVQTAGDIGIIRFQTAPHSYCDLRVTATTYGWVEGLWWASCPIAANILSVLQIFARVLSTDQVWIRYMSIHFGGHAQLAQ